MNGVREWLPPGAAQSEPVRRALDEALGRWTAKWFRKGGLTISDWRSLAGAAPPPASGAWHGQGQAVAASAGAAARLSLAGLGLGRKLDAAVLSKVDRAILEAFANLIVTDLQRTAAEALGAGTAGRLAEGSDPFAGGGGLVVRIGSDPGPTLVELAIPLPLVARFRKAAVKRPPAPAPLAGRSSTLARTPVRLEASVGTAILSVNELAGLAPGDILVLDRPIEQGASVAVAGCPPFCRGTLSNADESLSLVLRI